MEVDAWSGIEVSNFRSRYAHPTTLLADSVEAGVVQAAVGRTNAVDRNERLLGHLIRARQTDCGIAMPSAFAS